jgi:hypothetical protein
MNEIHRSAGRVWLAFSAALVVTACGSETQLFLPADGAAANDIAADGATGGAGLPDGADDPLSDTATMASEALDLLADGPAMPRDLLQAGGDLPSDGPSAVTDAVDSAAHLSEAASRDLAVDLEPDTGDGKQSSAGRDCANAIVPSNLVNGGVTDFSDWKSSKWGSTSGGLWGYVYGYRGPYSSMFVGASAAAKNLFAVGTVKPGDYAGAGIEFGVCATAVSFTQLQFTAVGSYPGCDLEVLIKTFAQQPITSLPAGGCDTSAPEGCYHFPSVKKVVVPATEPGPVVIRLSDVTDWSAQNAGQVIGIDWHWTPNGDLDPDAGIGCPIDVTISDIRFVQ